MSSPSPQKPKWSPGGAMRRTSTILSMGRSKTPSRASSEYESDASSSKVAPAAPPSPTPKSISPKSTLSTETSTEDPSATPSKSRLARMGGALRRSSLIPRRRTTSMASSIRDAESINSKTASAARPSIEAESAPRPILTAEPEPLVAAAADHHPSEHAVEPQPPVPEPITPPPVIESAGKTGFTDEPEELHEHEVVGEQPLSTVHEVPPVAIPGVEQEPASPPPSAEPVSAPIAVEQITAEPEAEQTPVTPIPTVEPVPTPPVADPSTLDQDEPESKQPIVPETPLAVEDPVESHTPPVADPSTLDQEEPEPKQPIVPETPLAVEAPVAPQTPEITASAPAVVDDIEPSSEPAVSDTVDEEQAAPSSPIVEFETSIATESTAVEPLHEVSSLNSSFEDLGMSAKLAEQEAVTQQAAVLDEPSVLMTPVEVVAAAPTETKVEDIASSIIPPFEEAPQAFATPEVASEKDQPAVAVAPLVAVLPVVEEQSTHRSLPLKIPETSVESAAPSPAATHPLLPLEVQEATVRQRNGSVAPANRDRHHNKGPEEYRSVLSTLLEALLGLIRRWRRGRW
ncbi:hypothetical protein DXG01_013009 [Tephrocybe rancida]|nr:hypothetical protein DXG01_013009 [Tephrocybe rancida]